TARGVAGCGAAISFAFGELEQPGGLAQRLRANGLDPNLVDNFQARSDSVKGRDAGRSIKQPPCIVTALQAGLEVERLAMGHPPGELRFQARARPRINPYKRRAGAATEPFQAAADVNIDAQRSDVHRDRTDRLVAVDNRDGADLAGTLGDRAHLVDVCG